MDLAASSAPEKAFDVESLALLSGLGDLREGISSPHGLSG
jgi:hypothetical protein